MDADSQRRSPPHPALEELERQRHQLVLSNELTAALSSAFTRTEVARTVFQRGLAVFGADAGVLALAPGADSTEVELFEGFGYPEQMMDAWRRFPIALRTPITDAIREQAPQWVHSPEEAIGRFPEWARAVMALPDRAWAALPLVVRGRALGALGFSYHAPQPFDPGHRSVMLSVAERCAQALDRADLYEQALRNEQRALQRAAELQAVLDTVPAAVWIARDARGERIEPNRFGAELLRRPRGSNVSLSGPEHEQLEYVVQRNGRVLTPDELPIQNAARTGTPVRDYEEDLVFKDGTVRHIFGSVVPVLGQDGLPTGAVGAFMDITDLKRAEAALRMSEARLRLAKDAAGIGIHDFDPVGGTLSWDERVRELWGVGADERITYETFLSGIHPDDRASTEAAVAEALDPGGDGVYRAEFRVRSRADQRTRWIAATGRVWFERGRATRLVGTVQDVTQAKLAEQALRDGEERFRTLAENAPDVITRFDRELRHLYANAAARAATGRSPEQLLGRTNEELGMPPELVERWAASTRRVFATARPETLEFTFDGPRGPAEFEAKLVPELAPDGSVRSVMALARDVTERRRAERQVREADRQKTAFLTVLAHELRNPLAPIRNGLQVLERAPPGGDVARRTLQIIRRQSEQLTRLVGDLLDVARITQGKIDLRLAPLDAREVLHRACDDARGTFEQRGVALHCAAPTEELRIEADAARVEQMLGNLLSNALKFTPAGGKVTASARRRGDRCELVVSDTGFGIDPADLDRIFDRFAQAERTRDRAAGGLGIGLNLVRDLAQLHGGSVRAASPGIGRGAEFVISLPLASSPGATTRRST